MTFDTTKILAAATPEDRTKAAAAFADSIKVTDLSKLSGATVDALKASLADKGKGNANARAGVLAAFRAISVAFGPAAEAVCVPMLGDALEALADKMKPVAVEADKFIEALFANLSAHAVMAVMPIILAERDGKWQSNLGRAQLLGQIAEKNSVQCNRCLKDIVPVLSSLMWDTKAQVKEASIAAMNKCCATVSNKDIQASIPAMVKCIEEPEKVTETVHKLAGIVFVQEIEASALAIMGPLLKRGMDDPATATKRNCARIIENMAKLVDDPYEVEPFVPLLLPQLKRAKDEVADPECRTVCEKAFDQLETSVKKPPTWQRIEREKVLNALKEIVGKGASENVLTYAAALAHSMLDLKRLSSDEWKATLSTHLALVLPAGKVDDAIAKWLEVCAKDVKIEEEKEDADDAEQLCDCNFSLAYGNKVLLNQTTLKLKRGYRYGLCGKNDSGKTSLMRAIADSQLEEQGFPSSDDLRTMFVETDVQGECNDGSERLLSELSVFEFVSKHAGLEKYGVTPEECREKLLAVGFAEDDSTMAPASLTKLVGRLSGGWRMKCALTRAMLMKADILLLDEPTNHLDPGNVKWVIDYLTSLTHVTSIIVSHDIKVLDQVCTHVLQIENLKLKQFKGNLTYVAENHCPELMSYFKLKATKFTMRFPVPGNLEGITSKGKHIMKMTNISFTYPSAVKAQLTNVTVRVSLSTRAACIGANGAGKSTMIKLLTGELQPDKEGPDGAKCGEVWKHPNARVAYVAQHAFHHIEHHLEKTPNEYIRWRYEHGSDKEGLEKVTTKLTAEDEALMKKPIIVDVEATDKNGAKIIKQEKRIFKRFTDGRRQMQKSKEQEYEVMWEGDAGFTSWVPRVKLVASGFEKVLKHTDERIAAKATQLVRPLTQKFVEQHLADVGLEAEFGTHTRMGALSGGQKVKVVLAGAMWNTPHIVILDEPTNYLDRDSLGAMAEAINEYAGGVVIISHNAQFVDQVCPEVWHLENHTLNLKGSYDWLESANKEAAKLAKQEDTYVDGLGNEVKLEKAKKKASKAELKKIKKSIAEKRKSGIEVYTDEELETAGFLPEV